MKKLNKAAEQDLAFKTLYEKARSAGLAAVEEAVQQNQIAAMIVQQRSSVLNDNSPVVKSYFVADGPCGFASVVIKAPKGEKADFPNTTKFCNYLKKSGQRMYKGYHGGYSISVSEFNQSLQKKELYAAAFAGVLQESGIFAYSESRID